MGLPVQDWPREMGGRVIDFSTGARGTDALDEGPANGDPESPINTAACDERFAEMAERNARFMFRVAHGLLRSVQDAEDAVQEALLKLYRGDAWLRMEDEKAFLARTVWHAGLDVIARRPKSWEPIEPGEREPASTRDSPEQSAANADQSALLRMLIEALPDDLRQPLILCAIEEMTSREVAIAMGIPEGTVRTRAMRARAELKRRFEAMQTSTATRNGEKR